MNFVNEHPWNAVDRTNLMQFLASDTGVKWAELVRLKAPRPKGASDHTNYESRALQSERYFGWLEVADFTESLTMADPESVGSMEWFVEKQENPRQQHPNPL
jgi:hypothetical protein